MFMPLDSATARASRKPRNCIESSVIRFFWSILLRIDWAKIPAMEPTTRKITTFPVAVAPVGLPEESRN